MTMGPSPAELLKCSAQSDEGTVCLNKAVARGLCGKHYLRKWREGALPGRVKKEPKTIAFTVRLNTEMHSALAKQLRASGRTLTDLIEEAISTHLQRAGLWPPKGDKR